MLGYKSNDKTNYLIRSESKSSKSFNEGSASGGRFETNNHYEGNVDQDISKLAARTHAEQSDVNHGGRRRMMSQQDGETARPGLVTGMTTFEKAAQGGRGFQTYGVDLGVLGSRNNVDDEMRRQSGGVASGGSQSSSSSNFHTQSSSGSQQGSSSGHQSGVQSFTDEDYGGEYDENEDEQSQDQHRSNSGSGSSWQSSSSYSQKVGRPLNVHHETVEQQFKHYPKRTVRQAPIQISDPLCKSTRCVNVRCVVGPLEKNNGALIALRTRLVAHTLHKVIIKR